MRLVGFDAKQQSDIAALTATQSPVKAENCQIKLSRDDSTTFEIMFGSKTKVLPSLRKIEFTSTPVIQPESNFASDILTMDSVKSLDDGMLINFTATVTSIKPATAVSTGILQELSVSDETASITLSAWEPFIGQFEPSCTYRSSPIQEREDVVVNAPKLLRTNRHKESSKARG